MASAEHSCEQVQRAQDVRHVVDTIPALAWSARSDGAADFFNQRWLDYTGLSAEQAGALGLDRRLSLRRLERTCGLLAIRSGFGRARRLKPSIRVLPITRRPECCSGKR